MPDLTIIVPHRGNPLGLWATIHSCEEDLRTSKHSYNYVIVTNGERLLDETTQTLEYLKRTGRLMEHIHTDDALSPPAARQRGAAVADGKTLVFFDNHCLVSKNFFDRVVVQMDHRNMDMLHATVKLYSAEETRYHYKLRLPYNFWASYAPLPKSEVLPYRIAAAGHGAFAVRRSAWEEVGGYGPETLLVGYGGEEIMFDLKMWLYGKEIWIDPKLLHYHYTGTRGYTRHFSDEYYVNLMVSANVIGGEEWLYKVYESFTTKAHIRVHPEKTMYELLVIAHTRSAEYAREVASKRTRTLDELLTWFKENDVPM